MRGIWEKFRAALCISGGNSRAPPTLSPPDHAAAGDEGGSGEGLSAPDHAASGDEGGAGEGLSAPDHAAAGDEGGGGGDDDGISPPDLVPAGDEGGGGAGEVEKEDLLSALPDDILLLVLLHLPSAAAAARTCVLSRRWSRLWAQLPELRFPLPVESAPARPSPVSATACAALARHEAPELRCLSIVANDADPRDVAAVLRLAAPRLTDELDFHNVLTKFPEAFLQKNFLEAGVFHQQKLLDAGVRTAVEMPCFDRAERLTLRLGYLGLVMPQSGVFKKLTMLHLAYVRFQGACDISNAFSSARFPSLQQLRLMDTSGVSNLAICSESLLSLWLENVKWLQQLTVVSTMLIELHLIHCFVRQPVVDIDAPVIEMIQWHDRYDPISVHLGEMVHLQRLATLFLEFPKHQYNWDTLMLLQCFQKIPYLYISIVHPPKMVNYRYLMEALTLPPVEHLWLRLVTIGHDIVSCIFHLLKASTSIRRLFLQIHEDISEQSACSLGCVCHQPQDWKTEELCLESLEELDICGFSNAECDFAFVKRLLGWTPVLKTVTINFDPFATIDKDLCKELRGLSGPDTCMKIYVYCDGAKVMYTPQG